MVDGVPHLLPQMPNMHGDSVIFPTVVLVLPYGVEQLLGADHAASLPAQDLQYGKLCGSQL